jgi:predicted trehalose synthase
VSAESDAVAAGGNDADGLKPTPTENAERPLPGEEAEASFLAEARERGEDVASVAAALAVAESEEEKNALPPLEELVQKLPAELRDTLDDLFRAKFVKVIRVRKADLPA